MNKFIKRFMCIENFFYNLTKPYHYFNKGEFYEFKVSKREGGIIIYESMDCDYISVEINFKKLFLTTEELRDIKINKILNKQNGENEQ